MSPNSEYPMRRASLEVTAPEDIDRIFEHARILTVAFQPSGQAPYCVPFNFGREGSTLYIHCADEGRKLDIIKRNPEVGFSLFGEAEVLSAEVPCKGKSRYRSIIGTATARTVEDESEKADELNVIMRQYGGPENPYPAPSLAQTCVVAFDIQSFSAKQSGFNEGFYKTIT